MTKIEELDSIRSERGQAPLEGGDSRPSQVSPTGRTIYLNDSESSIFSIISKIIDSLLF